MRYVYIQVCDTHDSWSFKKYCSHTFTVSTLESSVRTYETTKSANNAHFITEAFMFLPLYCRRLCGPHNFSSFQQQKYKKKLKISIHWVYQMDLICHHDRVFIPRTNRPLMPKAFPWYDASMKYIHYPMISPSVGYLMAIPGHLFAEGFVNWIYLWLALRRNYLISDG